MLQVDTKRRRYVSRVSIRYFTPADLDGVGDPVIVGTIGRSGTHLIVDIIRRQFASFAAWKWPGQPPDYLFLSLENVADHEFPAQQARHLLTRSRRMVVASHDWTASLLRLAQSEPEFTTWMRARASVVFVVRDPIVVLPKLWALFEQNDTPGKHSDPDTFVAKQAQRWATQVETNCRAPRTLTVRFEDLLSDACTAIERLATFLGEPARFIPPLLIPPHRTVVGRRLAWLNPRPLSTHVLLRARARHKFRFEWTPERLDILDAHAGNAMQAMGYIRPVEHRLDAHRRDMVEPIDRPITL